MIERDVQITTAGGVMPSFAVHPEGTGDFPAIIVYMDAPGIREELRNVARRIAKAGYYCLLPDLYYRVGTVRLNPTCPPTVKGPVARALKDTIDNTLVLEDTAAMLAFLGTEPAVRDGTLGCVGFCMSGAFVTAAAARFPNRLAAVASLHGTQLVTDKPDSPHLQLGSVKAELYYGFGEADPVVPLETVEAFKAALEKTSLTYDVDVFPGAQHGFTFAENSRAFNVAAAEISWSKIFALWQRTLGPPARPEP